MGRPSNATEWLAEVAPHSLLAGVVGRGKSRKQRLCAVAFCRLDTHLLPADPFLSALRVAEDYADRRASKEQLKQAHAASREAYHLLEATKTFGSLARQHIAAAIQNATNSSSQLFARGAAENCAFGLAQAQFPADMPYRWARDEADPYKRALDLRWQAIMVPLRDVLLNPFRPKTPGLSSLPGSVHSVAQAAYDERLPSWNLDPVRLCVLADALEDAGCEAADVLAHLRSPGPHVRGCWALDLVLGKG